MLKWRSRALIGYSEAELHNIQNNEIDPLVETEEESQPFFGPRPDFKTEVDCLLFQFNPGDVSLMKAQ